MVLAASEDKLHRGASIASPSHAVGVGHADARRTRRSPARTTSSGRATSTTWPPRSRRPATARRPTASLDYLWRVQKADGSWWQNTRVDGASTGRACSSTRSRCRSCSPGGSGRAAPPTGATSQRGGRLHRRERAEDRAGAVGEPGGLVAEHDRHRDRRRWSARPTSRGANGDAGARGALRGEGRRLAGARSRAGPRRPPARTRRSRTTCASPRTRNPDARHALRARRQPARARSTSARSSTTRSSGSCCSASSAGTTRPCSTRSPSATRSSAPTRPAAGSGTASRSTATARPPTAATGTSSEPGARRRSAARGRCSPASAASTSCSPAATRRRTCGTIAGTANDGLMLPEQVWDGRAAGRATAGEGTRSATPLAWTHAQFVRLAWSIAAGAPVERPAHRRLPLHRRAAADAPAGRRVALRVATVLDATVARRCFAMLISDAYHFGRPASSPPACGSRWRGRRAGCARRRAPTSPPRSPRRWPRSSATAR